jgi:hypothetical protein
MQNWIIKTGKDCNPVFASGESGLSGKNHRIAGKSGFGRMDRRFVARMTVAFKGRMLVGRHNHGAIAPI